MELEVKKDIQAKEEIDADCVADGKIDVKGETKPIKKFGELGIGDVYADTPKIDITEVVDKQIIVYSYKELDSHITKGTFVIIEIRLAGEETTKTFATGSKVLIKQLKAVQAKASFPFCATVKRQVSKNNLEYLTFE